MEMNFLFAEQNSVLNVYHFVNGKVSKNGGSNSM